MPPPAAMKWNFHDLIGSLLLATWVTSMLFAVVIRQTWLYFKNYPQDRLIIKLVVGLVVLGDIANVVGTHSSVYLYSIIHWGDMSYLTKQSWPVFVFDISTGIVTALVQGFLIFRYFSLTRNWAFLIFSLMLMGLALASLEATAAIFIIWPEYSEQWRAKNTVIVWLISSAVADVSISVALIWQLFSMRTSFSSQTEGYALIVICRVDNLPVLGSTIKRLIRQTIQTGSASSIIAVCTLIAYLKSKTSNVESLSLAYILEKVYVLTLLTNLNMRKTSQSTNTAFSNDEEMGKKSARINPTVTVDAIQVTRTVVRMDDPYTTPLDRDSHTNIDSDSMTKKEFNPEMDI
ncbi:hypothetical protein D9757_010643 [Collybiopsis confluens]|uniref:DUF6534 domain-containing protein n=1 Tax=Collybiopsis confluens TaxID=2823264 RepID=A0A8H5GME2_9AGAR|nr:hypothetical protein D9757_010643 [Collybiopsis confluens]